MTANEVATLAAEATPYVTAALSAYGVAVLVKTRDKVADATVRTGQRILQRVFGCKDSGDPLPEPLAALVSALDDQDALGAVRLAIRAALDSDAAMLAEVRGILTAAPSAPITQNIRPGRDAYVSARDMTVYRRPE